MPGLKIKKRILSLIFIFSALFLALGIRTAWIQFVNGSELKISAMEQQTRDKTINSKRGIIYDRNSQVLAQSASVETVTVTPSEIAANENPDEVAKKLAPILGMDEAEIKKIITKKSSYEIIKRKVEPNEADEIRKLGFSGIHLTEDTKRYYPYSNLASHVIGFVGMDNQGLDGIEMVFDNYLKGVPGRVISAQNAVGTDMPYTYEKYVDAQNGVNVVLTIDKVIQHFAEKGLEEAIDKYQVENGAACIIMNAKTGEILAMATKPDYNLNDPFTLNNQAVLDEINTFTGDERTKKLSEARQKMWRNKAVVDAYEPGSTFKSFVAAMALEENVVGLNDPFVCNGAFSIGGHSIRCWKAGGHGAVTFKQGVQGSCNPVFIAVGQRVGNTAFKKYYKAFGFTQTTGFELPGEAKGVFYNDNEFNEVELATSSFGQGPIVTPLQIVTALTAITNNGLMVKPRIVKALTDDDGNVVKSYGTETIRQVISKETAQTVREVLESVVSNGTSSNAYIKGYRVAGKTGTSEKLPRGNGRYIASFLGFAPANDPEIIGLVILDEPMGGVYFGGQIAAPTFGMIFEDVLKYLNIDTQYTQEELATLEIDVPNVVGLTIGEAKSAFAGSKLNYRIVGDGDTILSQVPIGGSSLQAGSTVLLYSEDESKSITTVPNVVGMGVVESNAAITNAGLNIRIVNNSSKVREGEAFVNLQNPPAGTEVQKGSVVSVEFVFTDVH